MNKKVIIGVVAVVLLAAGGWFVYSKNNEKSDDTKAKTSSKANTGDESFFNSDTNTLRGLLGFKNAVCTYNDQETSGTIYIANERKMRYDYVSTGPEEPGGSMIITEDVQYLWENGQKEGLKMHYNYDEDDSDIDAANQDEEAGVDMDEEYDFNCEKWSVNESVFTPPSDIEFTDMAELIQQYQPQPQQ